MIASGFDRNHSGKYRHFIRHPAARSHSTENSEEPVFKPIAFTGRDTLIPPCPPKPWRRRNSAFKVFRTLS